MSSLSGPFTQEPNGPRRGRRIPVLAAAYQYTLAEGFAFMPMDDDELDLAVLLERTALHDMSETLLAHDDLPRTGWHWAGINDGPVWDLTVGLTVHNVRVL